MPAELVETFRPLLPMGSELAAKAYRDAVVDLSAADLTNHYTSGLDFFHDTFVPHLKGRLAELTGGAWQLGDDYVAYAAGSDVDLMAHIIEAIAAREEVALYPGDWYGFLVGSTHQEKFVWTRESAQRLACLCLPSVRNGQLTQGMQSFLNDASACLLNINLFPTLEASERKGIATQLAPLLPKSILSVSFSRGFGLTASQLGVLLVHKDHPYHARFASQWRWLTYFFNMIAAKAFMAIEQPALDDLNSRRSDWVQEWLTSRGLPYVPTGSYYVKSFQVDGELPESHAPLRRGDRLRLCFKPSL